MDSFSCYGVFFHETRVSSCITNWLESTLFKFKCLFLAYFGEFSIILVIVACYSCFP